MMPHRSLRRMMFAALLSLLWGLALASTDMEILLNHTRRLPSEITFRVAILTKTVPLAYVDESAADDDDVPFPIYKGFQPDLLRELQVIAQDYYNITVTFDITEAPPFSYWETFELVTEDCNTTLNPQAWEDCNKYDIVVADFYSFYPRPLRVPFSPAFLTTAAAAVKYVHRTKRDITTLSEAQARQEPVCLHNDSFYDGQTMEKYPDLISLRCTTHAECLKWLKDENCVLFVEDELQLKYRTVKDPEIELTREKFNEQFIVWPINARLDPMYSELFMALIYQTKETGVLDALYDRYFSVNFCPVGWSGESCDEPCSPSHGISNRFGQCVCDSTKWTGIDCSIQVEEELNLLPSSLVTTGYVLVGINYALCLACAIWLALQRNRAQVQMAQPHLMALILVGCVISTSTIIALAQEDSGNGPVVSCVVFPWLYSIGFSITFGTLFAKIWRIYIVLKTAVQMRRVTVSVQDTALVVALVLAIDVAILTVWTAVDPLQWQRIVTSEDKFGYALESVGRCESDYWVVFASIIAGFHLLLMCTACAMCYLARHIPERLSNGKYVAVAMFSNLQIFVIAIPILVILADDPVSSFFIRSLVIWINDFVVVVLLFGDLIYKVYWYQNDMLDSGPMKDGSTRNIQNEVRAYAQKKMSQHGSSKVMVNSCNGSSKFMMNSCNDSSRELTLSTNQRETRSGTGSGPFDISSLRAQPRTYSDLKRNYASEALKTVSSVNVSFGSHSHSAAESEVTEHSTASHPNRRLQILSENEENYHSFGSDGEPSVHGDSGQVSMKNQIPEQSQTEADTDEYRKAMGDSADPEPPSIQTSDDQCEDTTTSNTPGQIEDRSKKMESTEMSV